MTQETTVLRAVRRALLGSSLTLMAAHSAVAQDADANAGPVQEVIITGSRLARPDFTADSPIVSVTSETFEEVAATSVEQVLNTLPQFAPSMTSTSNNPANNGQANIDLRGLGTNRNIVLMNGRRLPIANSNGTVDVNIVPAALVERVDIVTGGASAVYGSDAIAGVVNFVLRDNFEGVDLQSTYGISAEDDSEEWTAGVTMGSNFADDRGNAVFHFGYTERKAVLQGARDFSRVTLDVRRQGNTPLASGTYEQGRIVFGNNAPSQAALDQVFGAYGNYTPGSVGPSQALGTNADNTLFSAGGALASIPVVNFRGETDSSFNPLLYTYNFAPPNILNMPVARYNLATFFTYNMTDSVKAYVQAIYTDYDTSQQLAPTPATGFTSPATNPFIPADLRVLLDSRADPDAPFSFSRRMTEVGPRVSRNEYEVTQIVGGLEGRWGDYRWEVFAAKGQMDLFETQNNDLSTVNMEELLNSPTGSSEQGECIGFNPFGSGNVNEECADYLRTYFTNATRIDQVLAEATLGGKLFDMPAGEAMFSVGLGYHEDSFDFQPDAQVASGDLVGFNQQDALRGAIHTTELFGEARFPLLSERPFVRSLDLTLGYRWSDYNLSGPASAYKGELNWKVSDPLRIRASYNRAVRAPSVFELFSPANQGFPPLLEDPCSITSVARAGGDRTLGTADDPAARAQLESLCVTQGVTNMDSYNYTFVQIESFAGGNPNLSEESADTYTAGFVFEPPSDSAWLRDMQLSVDYWKIKLDDAILAVPAGEILLLCYNYSGGNPTFDPNTPTCQLIDRHDPDAQIPVTNGPVVKGTGLRNAATLSTAGIDMQLDWRLDLGGAGRLSSNLILSWLGEYDVVYQAGLPVIDRAGTIGDASESVGAAAAYPDYKLLLNLDYRFGDFRVGARYRLIASMDNKFQSYDDTTTVGVPSIDYIDLNASWYATEKAEISVGVINVTDQEPPLYTNPAQMNTDPSTYDVLGRRYFLRAAYKF